MSLEYMEYLMRLQSRACIAYLIHLNRRGAISNANLQEGINRAQKSPRLPRFSATFLCPFHSPCAPHSSPKKIILNKCCSKVKQLQKIMEQISATFLQMGLRSSKSVATHILLENAYESNLVPDISNVDYLAGNNGTCF